MPVNGLVNHPTLGDFGQNGVSFKLAHVKCHNRVGYKARKILKRCFLRGYKGYGFRDPGGPNTRGRTTASDTSSQLRKWYQYRVMWWNMNVNHCALLILCQSMQCWNLQEFLLLWYKRKGDEGKSYTTSKDIPLLTHSWLHTAECIPFLSLCECILEHRKVIISLSLPTLKCIPQLTTVV